MDIWIYLRIVLKYKYIQVFGVIIYNIVWLFLKFYVFFIFVFSKRSLRLFSLWYFWHVDARSMKSIGKCFTVYALWQAMHLGRTLFIRRNERVILVRPILILECMTSFRVSLIFWCHSPRIGFIWFSLLFGNDFQDSRYLFKIYVPMAALKSVWSNV